MTPTLLLLASWAALAAALVFAYMRGALGPDAGAIASMIRDAGALVWVFAGWVGIGTVIDEGIRGKVVGLLRKPGGAYVIIVLGFGGAGGVAWLGFGMVAVDFVCSPQVERVYVDGRLSADACTKTAYVRPAATIAWSERSGVSHAAQTLTELERQGRLCPDRRLLLCGSAWSHDIGSAVTRDSDPQCGGAPSLTVPVTVVRPAGLKNERLDELVVRVRNSEHDLNLQSACGFDPPSGGEGKVHLVGVEDCLAPEGRFHHVQATVCGALPGANASDLLTIRVEGAPTSGAVRDCRCGAPS